MQSREIIKTCQNKNI